MKPNVTTNHIMVTIAPVHDRTRHQECEYCKILYFSCIL